MKRYVLYGASDRPLDEVAARLSQLTGLAFEARESSYFGDYFRTQGFDFPEIEVKENARDDEGYLLDEDYPEHQTLVYLNRATPELERVVSEATWLVVLRTDDFA